MHAMNGPQRLRLNLRRIIYACKLKKQYIATIINLDEFHHNVYESE
jgi:hypothetical protein